MGEGVMIYGVGGTRRTPVASKKIAEVLYDIRDKGYSSVKPFSIGRVEKRMLEYANRNGITLGSKDIYMGSKSISHTMRETKRQKRLAISEGDLISFPVSRRKMELFYDGEGFIYTDRKSKYIIHPNYKIKTSNGKTRKAMFVTAGRVNDPREFENPKYKKV